MLRVDKYWSSCQSIIFTACEMRRVKYYHLHLTHRHVISIYRASEFIMMFGLHVNGVLIRFTHKVRVRIAFILPLRTHVPYHSTNYSSLSLQVFAPRHLERF